MTDKLISNIEEIPLSGDDLLAIARCLNTKRVKWILYDDLVKFQSLNELFGSEYDSVYILLQIKSDSGVSNVGHWVCLIFHREVDEYYYFDPYGLSIVEDLALSHESDVLLKLTKGVNITENKRQFQAQRAEINTCGRHCCVRSVFYHLDNEEYYKLVIKPIVPIPIRESDSLVSLFTALAASSDTHLIEFYNKKEKS